MPGSEVWGLSEQRVDGACESAQGESAPTRERSGCEAGYRRVVRASGNCGGGISEFSVEDGGIGGCFAIGRSRRASLFREDERAANSGGGFQFAEYCKAHARGAHPLDDFGRRLGAVASTAWEPGD